MASERKAVSSSLPFPFPQAGKEIRTRVDTQLIDQGQPLRRWGARGARSIIPAYWSQIAYLGSSGKENSVTWFQLLCFGLSYHNSLACT